MGVQDKGKPKGLFVLRRKEEGLYIFIASEKLEPFETKNPEAGLHVFNSKKDAMHYKQEHGLHKKFFPASLDKVNKYFKAVGIEQAFYKAKDIPDDAYAIVNVSHDGNMLILHPHPKHSYHWMSESKGTAIFTKKGANHNIRQLAEQAHRIRSKAIQFSLVLEMFEMPVVERFKIMHYYYLRNVNNPELYFSSESETGLPVDKANGFPKMEALECVKLADEPLEIVKIE